MTQDSDIEGRIRQRAHEIWLEEGQPTGREHQHWEQATGEIEDAASETSPDFVRSPGGAGDQSETVSPRQASRAGPLNNKL